MPADNPDGTLHEQGLSPNETVQKRLLGQTLRGQFLPCSGAKQVQPACPERGEQDAENVADRAPIPRSRDDQQRNPDADERHSEECCRSSIELHPTRRGLRSAGESKCRVCTAAAAKPLLPPYHHRKRRLMRQQRPSSRRRPSRETARS